MPLLDLEIQSLAVRLADLDEEERALVLEAFTADELEQIWGTWEFERRKNQIPPEVFFILAVKGGRGSGKTRVGAEWVTDRIVDGSVWVHLLSRTPADVRDTMINGESGLIAVAHRRGIEAVYEPSKRRLWYPDFGAQALMFSAQEPEQSRGPQCETGWVDEFSTFPRKTDSVGNTAMTNFVFGCRLGSDPRLVVTFTPKTREDVKTLIDRGKDPNDSRVALLEMSLYDNIANLPDPYLDEVLGTYKGTRLEAQEIHGEYLDVVEGAIWSSELIDARRVEDHPPLDRVVVGVDPPGEEGAECGIVIAGIEASSSDRKRAFVLGDLSIRGAPEVWAKRAVEAVRFYGAWGIVAEVNQGYDMVRACIHAVDPTVKVRKVTAHEGKRARAEPIELLYEATRVFHVGSPSDFLLLEGQMTGWDPNEKNAPSPDRMDALVWVMTDLFGMMNRSKGKASSAADLRLPDVGSLGR